MGNEESRANIESLFGIDRMPSDNTIRNLLGTCPTDVFVVTVARSKLPSTALSCAGVVGGACSRKRASLRRQFRHLKQAKGLEPLSGPDRRCDQATSSRTTRAGN